MKFYDITKKYLWLLIFPIIFLVYSNSFDDFPVIEKQMDVLADSDSANFIILIKDFSLSKKYGNEYSTTNRSPGDIAQKHKIHHILYVLVASFIFEGFSFFYRAIGMPTHKAVYSVNAFLSCCNLGLLYWLIRHFNKDKSKVIMYLTFYAFSLSTWIYSSVPGSWTFTTTLILLFLVLFYIKKIHPFVLSLFIGISMLNNVFLISLFMFPLTQFILSATNIKEFIKNNLLSGVIIILTWLASLSFFSLFDDSLGPKNVIRYTLWFKDFLGYGVTVFSLYVWKVIISNVFVTSILSNQSNPLVPAEALLYTLKEGYIGILSTIIYLCLFITIILRILSSIAKIFRENNQLPKIFEREEFHLIGYVMVWIFLILIMYPPGAFLYSVTIVPFMVILTAKYVDLGRFKDQMLLSTCLIAIILNNVVQVMKFRNALAVMQ